MHFSFLINPTDDWQSAVNHALHLVKQARIKQDSIAVFFYGSAVHIAQDTKQHAQWHDLSDGPLYLCRTMMDAYDVSDRDLVAPFKVIGMAPWITIMEQADRIVEIV